MRDAITPVAALWGIDVQKDHPEIVIAGSPERFEFRVVIEDVSGELFVLEQVCHPDHRHKERIAEALEMLQKRGLERILPYCRNREGKFLGVCDGRIWLARPYLEGAPLQRPDYVRDGWRGEVLAEFLVELGKRSLGIQGRGGTALFSIKDYIYRLLGQIERHNPELFERVQPVVRFLERRFMDLHDFLPAAFCHGDYHPLNVIWSREGIGAVIDWEFHGLKPEAYDVANLIGCIGVEDPSGLNGPLVSAILERLQQSSLLCRSSWGCLVELVVAIRFAWLSEWLRFQDAEMIELELTYMNLLLDNHDIFRETWGLPRCTSRRRAC